MTTKERLYKIISEHLGVAVEDLKPEARFEEDLGADSLDKVELVMALEEEFGIPEISDADRDRILRVEDAVKYVENAEQVGG